MIEKEELTEWLKQEHYIARYYLDKQDYRGYNIYLANLLQTHSIVIQSVADVQIEYSREVLIKHLESLMHLLKNGCLPPAENYHLIPKADKK